MEGSLSTVWKVILAIVAIALVVVAALVVTTLVHRVKLEEEEERIEQDLGETILRETLDRGNVHVVMVATGLTTSQDISKGVAEILRKSEHPARVYITIGVDAIDYAVLNHTMIPHLSRNALPYLLGLAKGGGLQGGHDTVEVATVQNVQTVPVRGLKRLHASTSTVGSGPHYARCVFQVLKALKVKDKGGKGAMAKVEAAVDEYLPFVRRLRFRPKRRDLVVLLPAPHSYDLANNWESKLLAQRKPGTLTTWLPCPVSERHQNLREGPVPDDILLPTEYLQLRAQPFLTFRTCGVLEDQETSHAPNRLQSMINAELWALYADDEVTLRHLEERRTAMGSAGLMSILSMFSHKKTTPRWQLLPSWVDDTEVSQTIREDQPAFATVLNPEGLMGSFQDLYRVFYPFSDKKLYEAGVSGPCKSAGADASSTESKFSAVLATDEAAEMVEFLERIRRNKKAEAWLEERLGDNAQIADTLVNQVRKVGAEQMAEARMSLRDAATGLRANGLEAALLTTFAIATGLSVEPLRVEKTLVMGNVFPGADASGWILTTEMLQGAARTQLLPRAILGPVTLSKKEAGTALEEARPVQDNHIWVSTLLDMTDRARKARRDKEAREKDGEVEEDNIYIKMAKSGIGSMVLNAIPGRR